MSEEFNWEEYNKEQKLREEEIEKQKERLLEILKQFDKWLEAKGFKEKTVITHLSNIAFYLENFFFSYYVNLDDDEAPTVEEAYEGFSYFFGNFFIRKCLWSNEKSTRQYAASFKRFYTFLYEKEMVSQDILQCVKQIFKEELPQWVEKVNRYNRGEMTESEMMDFWFD